MPVSLPGRFYPVVDSADWVRRMTLAGAKLIQLRIKQASAAGIEAEVRAAAETCAANGATLVLNDHWRLAIDLRLGFVHLGQADLDTADLAAIRRAGIRLGLSTHDDAERERALSLSPDYIALGPIWPTTLKVMPWAPQGTARLTEWKRHCGDIPLVAIGGITLDRAQACRDAGADAVAMVSDVTGHADPDRRAREWLRILDEIDRADGGRAGGCIRQRWRRCLDLGWRWSR